MNDRTALLAARDALHNAGFALSNCAFNLAQRAGSVLSASDADVLDRCRRDWDAAAAALAQVEAALVVPVWRPIETAPKDGALFLCWVSAVQYGESDEGQQYQIDVSQADFCQWHAFEEAPDGGWFEPCCGHISDQQAVTHWMPLPEPPAAGASDSALQSTGKPE